MNKDDLTHPLNGETVIIGLKRARSGLTDVAITEAGCRLR